MVLGGSRGFQLVLGGFRWLKRCLRCSRHGIREARNSHSKIMHVEELAAAVVAPGGLSQHVPEELRRLALDTEVGAQLIRFKWRPVFGVKARPGRHINCDEGKAYRFLMKRDALKKQETPQFLFFQCFCDVSLMASWSRFG